MTVWLCYQGVWQTIQIPSYMGSVYEKFNCWASNARLNSIE